MNGNRLDPDSDTREIDAWLGRHAARSRHPLHRALQAIALPLLLWSLLAFGWAIPVPEGLGRPGLWSALGAVGVFGWAQRRSRAIAWLLVVVVAAMLAATHWLHGLLGTERLTMLSAIALATASLALLAGRRIEGLTLAPRVVFDDVATGVLALCASVLRRFGISS